MVSLYNDEFQVKIHPAGAELHSVFSVKNSIEYLWQAEKETWPRHAPNLFPIVGKLKNGSYSFEGKKYELPQHGFARDLNFELISSSQTSAVFELCANEETLKVFPFHFSFKISYSLLGDKLRTNYSVFNPFHEPLYFSLGAHPGFSCQVKNAVGLEDFFIEFENEETTKRFFVEEGLISPETENFKTENKKFFLKKEIFAKDALVFKDLSSHSLKLLNTKNTHGIKMEWSPEFSYFGIWTKPNCDKFICLEPWTGIADSTNTSGNLIEKEGI
ncbi:MAG: aldose 1-epimerase family protein, partial [Bacteroidia bacterium]|nr:aldose 1-epimerase family protein [Bacteroidia bacterium]